MKLIDSILSDLIIEKHTVSVGEIFFLEDVVIAEIKEGAHIDFNNSQEYIQIINHFYGTDKPFAYICNRINNFSISPLDYPKFNKALNNLSIYGIVHNNHFDRLNYEIEKRFCNKPFKSYSDLTSAFNQINIFLNKEKPASLNKAS